MQHVCLTRGAMCALLVMTTLRPAAAQSTLLNQELLKDWLQMKDMLMKLANEMPERQILLQSDARRARFRPASAARGRAAISSI